MDDPQYFSFERKGWYSYIKDQVGTITKVYKHETKQMVNSKTFDTFGNLVNQTGSSAGNLGFQSKYYDQESGLNYFYHRYYSPSTGRFASIDPLELSCDLNLYSFVRNNPITSIDPLCLICIPWPKESTKWYFEKYPHDKINFSLDISGFNPSKTVFCNWKKTSFGYKERLARTRKLCIEYICGFWNTYFKYGEWKVERKDDVYDVELITTVGWGWSSSDITKMGKVCCQNPWPPFNIKCKTTKNH